MATFKITFESTTTRTGYVIADTAQDAVDKLFYPCTRDEDGKIIDTWSAGDGPGWDAENSTNVGAVTSLVDLENPDDIVTVPDAVAPSDW
jgi:hypothetical protein